MTYKQMTKEIAEIDEQIKFLYDIRKEYFLGTSDKGGMIGNIVNSLCAYKNYLKYTKEYNTNENN